MKEIPVNLEEWQRAERIAAEWTVEVLNRSRARVLAREERIARNEEHD